MPAGDGTGPYGMGPMSGRRAGYCAGYNAPGYANFAPGRGMGRGRFGGRGRGGRGGRWRHRWTYQPPAWGAAPYAAPPAPGDEVEALKTQAEWLQDQLQAISQRIAELEGEK
jgi:hypothetical protein